jgi:type I restriction enzyme, S subunit
VKDFRDYSVPRYDQLNEINPDGVVKDAHLLRRNDVIFVRSNGNRELIGRSMMILSAPSLPVTHSAFTIRARIRDRHDLNPRFFAYVFRSGVIRQILTAHGSGANISNLNQDILSRLLVPHPPRNAQNRITSILSAYDDLIENNTRRIAILEDMARRLFEEWFVHFRFPGHEEAKFEGGLPQGWQTTNLAAITSFVSRGITPNYDDEGPSIVINQKCIRDQRLSLAPARRQKKRIPDLKQIQFGDVLINSTGVGTLGRVAQVLEELEATTIDTHVTIVRPGSDVDMYFFGAALLNMQTYFEHQGVGATGQTELSRARIYEKEITLPSIQLQARFAELIRSTRTLGNNLLKKNRNLRAQRDLLLPKLVSGEIDVSAAEKSLEDAA